jgi:hypothetical protein
MSQLQNSLQLEQSIYGTTLVSPASVVPTVSGTLRTVAGGPIRITGVVAIVTTVFTSTVTTFNMGTAAGATTLFNATALTSLTVGTTLVGIPTPAAPVVAAAGLISWIASVANTGQLQVYISYIPVIAGVTVV